MFIITYLGLVINKRQLKLDLIRLFTDLTYFVIFINLKITF